ncbi:DUF3224 domain-containing protein [Litorilituus lipolyticus]|uniref:DUF3224 domain-containing protein n=1 Tax=Litorilituus lipolyticus TaxID=2491017 RepID=A0A502L5S0_9GAMM|nr:DUF3224 domain-containing protein [Litorilituus lipolyticus]TPH15667.1 DUF3224 domain-containing protein [Litorilituus lipolyticus]
MQLSGSFEITLEPQQDEQSPAGRMLINKQYSGGLEGVGIGQMLSKRTEAGASVYAAIEEFEGKVNGKQGSFSLFHTGQMSASSQELNIMIVEGSGSGALEGITGTLAITQSGGAHAYTFEYSL